jgi:hypothetical protein
MPDNPSPLSVVNPDCTGFIIDTFQGYAYLIFITKKISVLNAIF